MHRHATRSWIVFAVLVIAALALSPALRADKRPYGFDRAHSEVNFVAEALLLTAHGYYDKWDADVQIDPDNIENSSVSFTIDASSINTRNERRDNHLRSADFFDVANHPNITFVSKSVRRVDERNIVITGDLTIRGVTKEIQVPTHVVFLRDGRGRFKGEFQINRKEFGVSYNSNMNPIEDIVKVQFDLNVLDREMQRQRQQGKKSGS